MGCAATVRGTLQEMDGVYDEPMDLNINTHTATFSVDEEKFDVDAALAKLEEIHFPATVKE